MIAAPALDEQYDILLVKGRVLDPESNLDAVGHSGLIAGKMAAVCAAPLEGRRPWMFAAWWCRPDSSIYYTHTRQTRENYGFKARDGVTTRLETDVDVNPVSACMQRARPGCHQLRSNEKNIFQRA